MWFYFLEINKLQNVYNEPIIFSIVCEQDYIYRRVNF